MNRQTIITFLLALVAMTGLAKTYKSIKKPEAMACLNVSNGELKAREVIFRDTATTVHFTMEYSKGQSFQFVSSSYLMDEDGNRYPLRSAGERTKEGSEAYKKYVAEWLADEETVCVTNADFTRLQELFRFNGIPHYETITPTAAASAMICKFKASGTSTTN